MIQFPETTDLLTREITAWREHAKRTRDDADSLQDRADECRRLAGVAESKILDYENALRELRKGPPPT